MIDHASLENAEMIAVGATAEIYSWGENQVLKLFKADQPQEWIDQEQFFAGVAFGSGLPVPQVHWSVETDNYTHAEAEHS